MNYFEWCCVVFLGLLCVLTVEAKQAYFGDCDMHPNNLVSETLEVITIDESIGFEETEFIPPWYQLWGNGADWPFEPEAYARYFHEDNSVHLNLNAMKQFGVLEQCSIIAHEITHALQFQSGVEHDVRILETGAYHIQDLFIRSHLAEYGQKQALQGNGISQMRQFRKLQRLMASIGTGHDLMNVQPEMCSGDGMNVICIWQ